MSEMKHKSIALLLNVWAEPKLALSLAIPEQNLLVRQSSSAYICAQLWKKLQKANAIKNFCTKAKLHFLSAVTKAERQVGQGHYEIKKLADLSQKYQLDFILLKGAAYIAKNLPNAEGRLYSDIDLLVGKENLNWVESELMLTGFRRTVIDSYDEQYYRKWMHEIPPLRHNKRSVVLDVHHNILPLTVSNPTDISLIQARAIPLENGLKTLSNEDMLLHCAVHLFHEGEFEKGLRDLIDLDFLFRHFSIENSEFQTELFERAKQLGLSYNLFLATYFCKLVLGTPFEADYFSNVMLYAPNKYKLTLLRVLFREIFIPHHSSCVTIKFRIARSSLYIRGHLIRMPLRLLIPHLARKSIMRIKDLFKKEKADTFAG